jgi:hypothetical protein
MNRPLPTKAGADFRLISYLSFRSDLKSERRVIGFRRISHLPTTNAIESLSAGGPLECLSAAWASPAFGDARFATLRIASRLAYLALRLAYPDWISSVNFFFLESLIFGYPPSSA